jgi:hypothetical protein
LAIDLNNEKILERYKKVILGLESLIRIVTIGKSDRRISITVNVHGTFISGDLVSIENFHRNMKTVLLDNLDEKNNPEFYETIRDALQILENINIIDANSNFIFDYICVKDASIYTPGSRTFVVPFWIGKLESVDGFFMGAMHYDQDVR